MALRAKAQITRPSGPNEIQVLQNFLLVVKHESGARPGGLTRESGARCHQEHESGARGHQEHESGATRSKSKGKSPLTALRDRKRVEIGFNGSRRRPFINSINKARFRVQLTKRHAATSGIVLSLRASIPF
ncbi:hypothetical protein CEXT_545001 [Caerostris extrusa]|uniref:Uncharacterized protein n=1 Tax=Caerostris extrusa TaxID=172846 RepID=A0AAV4X4N0_CAEEX|nr:hypothetical protein CEXT_545001 [Caerostris extrusa]